MRSRTARLEPLLALAVALPAGGCRTALRPPADLRATDLDGDGRLDRFEAMGPGGHVLRTIDAPSPGAVPPRTLVLAIDAVPFTVFEQLQQEGLFRELFPASRLVAPFPSLTDVSFTTILRTPPSASYEDLVFDRATGRTHGGLGDRILNRYRALGPFHQVWDEEAPSLWGGLVYFLPQRIARAELRRVEKALLERDDPELVLYLGSTDAFAHKLGWEALATYLRDVYQVLRKFLAAGGAERRIVLFSDHGMSRAAGKRFPLERALAASGFSLRKRLERPQDVVAPAYGLIGSIQIYTACGHEAEVAAAVLTMPGADFAAWLEGGEVRVLSRAGDDPRARDPADYPDLERRLARALPGSAVSHPASVIVSLDDGWYYGSSFLDAFADITGTHGNARADASIGFLASNVERTPSVLAAHEAYPCLGLQRAAADLGPVPDPCAVAPLPSAAGSTGATP